MAANRKLDWRRDDLCADALRKRALKCSRPLLRQSSPSNARRRISLANSSITFCTSIVVVSAHAIGIILPPTLSLMPLVGKSVPFAGFGAPLLFYRERFRLPLTNQTAYVGGQGVPESDFNGQPRTD